MPAPPPPPSLTPRDLNSSYMENDGDSVPLLDLALISNMVTETRRQAGHFDSNELRKGDKGIKPVAAPVFSATGNTPTPKVALDLSLIHI